MSNVSLEEIIRRYVPLPLHANNKGWFSVLCKVCNDHGRKGPRAAFKFENETVGYNCFNCGHTAIYDPNNSITPKATTQEEKAISDDMVKVLYSFGIPENEWQQLILNNLRDVHTNGKKKKRENPVSSSIEPKEIPLPSHFYKLGSSDSEDKWTVIARDYLEYQRGIDADSYPFYLSTGGSTKYEKKWLGRLMIPIYKDGKLIFYLGRALTGKVAGAKYLNAPVDRENTLYGYDHIQDNTELPLYVVEGWFDAQAVDGVAVFGNRLSSGQISWLNRTRRPKVIIPDRLGDGHLLAEHALDLGWQVSFPEIGNCKDVSESVQRFGKLYVMKSIVDNTMAGFAAMTHLGVLCSHGQNTSKNKS